jgi:hypothetical protein
VLSKFTKAPFQHGVVAAGKSPVRSQRNFMVEHASKDAGAVIIGTLEEGAGSGPGTPVMCSAGHKFHVFRISNATVACTVVGLFKLLSQQLLYPSRSPRHQSLPLCGT